MSLRKRGETWHVDITAPDGTRIRRSTETTDRTEAQEYHDTLKAELWRTVKLGERQKHTWEEAVVRFLHETEHKASRGDDVSRLRWLDNHLAGKLLDSITQDVIFKIKTAKLKEASQATVNRHLALIRSILRRAEREWEWLEKAPAIRLFPEPTQRIRYLTREEAIRLIAELPAHLQSMVRFTLSTGLRQANVTGLEWSQVNLDRNMAWIHPDQAKAKRAISVPLNEEAMEVLKGEVGKHPQFVFTYQGNPIKNPNHLAWRNALVRAEIPNFRWHDLRHTWASWHIQAGTPIHVLQDLGGWESVEMVRRYAHLGGQHLAQFAGAVTLGNGTNSSQPRLRLVSNGR